MNRLLSTFLLFFAVGVAAYGQYGFGTNAPDPSAVVDMTSTNKGVLIPRVALSATNVETIPGADSFLWVFNTFKSNSGTYQVKPGFYFRSQDKSSWMRLLESIPIWLQNGNAATDDDNYLGASAGYSIIFKTNNSERLRIAATFGNVGIGTNADPQSCALLELSSTTKGFLPPRMTTAQIAAIASASSAASNGLMVFNTENNTFYVIVDKVAKPVYQ